MKGRETVGENRRVRILLVEDELVIAESLKRVLAAQGYSVLPVVMSGEAALREAVASSPDVVLMDIRLEGGLDGIQTAARMRSMLDAPIIYLTAYGDDPTLERAMPTRPDGYLLKPIKERELKAVIETALYRRRHDRRAPEAAAPPGPPQEPDDAQLTPREREVTKMISAGMTSKEIASALGISVRTVETHRENILSKLGLRSSMELVGYALRNGLANL
jgi:DNA-binding NarL/FixJ family response regulator